ncbi:MAG: MaoC family dehydratase [Bryobacteraceae bacterium]|nr:MaoC family dehydratase [Bryobacteraceae bacterium]MDW8378052.1 MaoC family dehydratase [Bryobacterales bacterium]
MARREVATIQELAQCTGQEVALSDWFEITQERIDAFAKATGDFQWIHVDQERAARESPFGVTIAHGFLTLSLLSRFAQSAIDIRQPFHLVINYGLNRVRFPAPVRCGARIRTRHLLLEAAEISGGWQLRWQVTVELEGSDKPACVAETITRYYERFP